jgi:chromate reductase, NAD(P)H dehydrogenase (quinone)
MSHKQLTFYALCGSQRRASTNRALLEAMRMLAPDHIDIEICDLIGDLPIFNPDREGEHTPEIVERFAAGIRAADGLIIACPEYAHGIPGGLKNALDWLVSRDEVPLKPVMIAHSSHRGELVLAQLTDVLKTMSLVLVTEAFVKLPLVGKSEETQQALLSEAGSQALLGAALRQFACSISQLQA